MIDFATKARTFYENLEPARQTQLWLAAVGLLIATIGVSWWMTTVPQTQLPFGSEVEMREAAALLRENGIPATFDGTNLAVPTAQAAAAQGVISAMNKRPSMSDVTDIPVGAPPSAVAYGKLRQLEGDLAQQIAEIPGIHAAFVKLTPGIRTLFRDEQDTPGKASVFLDVAPTYPPSAEAVRGISSMVANARHDLDPSYVAIVDSLGVVHQDGTGQSASESTMSRDLLALKKGYEAEAEAKVARHLRSLVGMDNSFMVAATAMVEHESRVIRSTDYDADKIIPIKKSLNEEAREKSEPAAEGTPGVDSKLPERNAEAAGPAGGGKNKEDKTRIQEENIAPETQEQIIIPAGALKQLSVSVSIDETKLAEAWGITPDDAAWAEKTTALQAHLREAAGLSASREDSMSLIAMPFAAIPVAEPPSVTVNGALATVAPFVPYAIATVALLLAFIFVIRPLMAQVAKAPLPRPALAQEAILGPDGKPIRKSEEDEDELFERVHQMVENFQPIDKDDVNRLVQQQTDATAKVVRDWMKQGA